MQLRQTRVWSLTYATLIATAVVGLLIVAFCSVEFLYAKHYFTIQWRWYELSFPWNWLSFAFFLNRFPEPESTLLVAGLTGVGGATVWWSMSRLAYPRGVLSSLMGSLSIAYMASLMAWAATFSELLVIQVGQAFVLIAFFTLVPRIISTAAGADVVKTRQGPRFSLWDLLILVALISVFLIVVRPALMNKLGYINLWLPILGVSTGVVTLLFLLSYQASLRTRVVLLALCIPSAVALGYGLASAFPKLRILWSFYTGSYAVGTFRYFTPAYMVWFALTGLLAVATLSFIRMAISFASRFQSVRGTLSRIGWTTTETCEVINSSR